MEKKFLIETVSWHFNADTEKIRQLTQELLDSSYVRDPAEESGFLCFSLSRSALPSYLRQQHPSLPQRPLLIAGPSGSGKTEVWRVAKKLYGDTFFIRIIDGSNISGEGWSGNYKIDTYMHAQITDGGILVVDEFDKLVTPKHSSSGESVSLSIQAEFLKLVEGEYCVSKKKELTSMTSKMMGFVMVGTFEALRQWKQNMQSAGCQGLSGHHPRTPLPCGRNRTGAEAVRCALLGCHLR